ncbi:unnamed protein product [Closterium sp. Naga37s-1]|nr:unnamed protein product [Closterium sp. Naga37s-1]
MFQRMLNGGSHRQRLELHSAMVAMESPIPSTRRMSLQIDDLERPMHRNSAYNGQDVFGRPSGQPLMQPQLEAGFDHSASAVRTQTPAPAPAPAASAAPGATDWACLYAPHNDPSRRRRSLDCIRSARKSDRSAVAINAVNDASSVDARSQALHAANGAGGAGSDSEEEVCSTRAERRGTAAAQTLRQPRNVFVTNPWQAGTVSGDIAAGVQRGQAGGARRGGTINDCAMDVDGGDGWGGVEAWGGVEQAMHPAGLMQARAAMVAQGGGIGGAQPHAVAGSHRGAVMSNPWAS